MLGEHGRAKFKTVVILQLFDLFAESSGFQLVLTESGESPHDSYLSPVTEASSPGATSFTTKNFSPRRLIAADRRDSGRWRRLASACSCCDRRLSSRKQFCRLSRGSAGGKKTIGPNEKRFSASPRFSRRGLHLFFFIRVLREKSRAV